MNISRLTICFALITAAPLFAASKEMIELQRDVAQLQEQTRLLQQSIDTKMAQLQVLAQQSVESSNRANTSVADLSRSIQASGADLGKQVLQPMAALSTRIDGMAQDLQSLQAGVADQSARMAKVQQQLVDLKNALSTMPAPGAAPPPAGATPGPNGAPTSTVPAANDPAAPPIPASQLWQNAKRDMDSGNSDLALNEFQDYLKFYRTTDLAPNAQFNIGQIHYTQHKLDVAVKDFDQVLEAFPTNPKTPDAHYMKGRALIQLGQRNEAAREFNAVVAQFPSSGAAATSKAALKTVGPESASRAGARDCTPPQVRFAAFLLAVRLSAALHSYPGTTPRLDGVLSPGEWSDATPFTGTAQWTATFTKTTDPQDLSLKGWVKHDRNYLYFAFDVTDDVLYGIDTPRWLPDENPLAHELTQKGFPWFGDEMELLINSRNTWKGNEGAAGNGSSWQMVCNLTKSRKGGIGTGGLLEGEPRVDQQAWDTYRRWIDTGAQQAVAKPKPQGHGYIIEWAVRFDPCLEIAPGQFYRPEQDATVGLNIALGDLDRKEDGKGNFGNFHHEDWLSGGRKTRTDLRDFTTLTLHAQKKP